MKNKLENKNKKNFFLKKIKIVLFILFLTFTTIKLIHAAINYFSQKQTFKRNYKIGRISQEFLKTNLKSENDSNTKELIPLNVPFIDTDKHTYSIEETHEVKLDKDELKNKLKTTQDQGYDLLKTNRWLNIDYNIYLVAKNNKVEDNLMIINTQENIDMTTEIFDANSNNQSIETSIFPVQISYIKNNPNIFNTQQQFQSYVDNSGNINRPEMFIPRINNQNWPQDKEQRLNNLKDPNKITQEVQQIIDKLKSKRGTSLSLIEEQNTKNRLNNLKDQSKITQEVQQIISELEAKSQNNSIDNSEIQRLNNLKDPNKKNNEITKIISDLNKNIIGSLNNDEFERLNNLEDTNKQNQETKKIISELETERENFFDKYISYDIKISISANVELNKENLESFFEEYNNNNPNKSIKYTDFADNEYDTPKISCIIKYELVDNNGNSITNNYKDNSGKKGVYEHLSKNKLNKKDTNQKIKIKLVNKNNNSQQIQNT
ncbi:hypothetical protein [Candidatus Phytoplasma sacchari]|uniref:Uncharacterized protein n=1 Tax=Candidatus Phytoplasma sacchari TaxID=2609813 RepID=A0ABY7M349_9MOLU|nr:hypothetical protein O7R10_00070 [Candidatus Phytoplasma sacchari]